MNKATGSTCDISSLLRFHFWQPFYFNSDDSNFPSGSTEETGRFVGISENEGHEMNFSILNITTNKVISMSNSRPEGEPTLPNLRIDPLTAPDVVKSLHPSDHIEDKEKAPTYAEKYSPNTSTSSTKHSMHVLDPKDLVGRTFLIAQEDGQRLRARTVKAIDDYEGDLQRDYSIMKFICSTKDDTVEDAFNCNEILDQINK